MDILTPQINQSGKTVTLDADEIKTGTAKENNRRFPNLLNKKKKQPTIILSDWLIMIPTQIFVSF